MNFSDVVQAFNANPRSVKVAGGSVRGSTDHFIFARAIEMAGGDPSKVVYIAYDGGGKAMAGILSHESHLLSTGLSEAIDMARAGEVRVIAVTAVQRLDWQSRLTCQPSRSRATHLEFLQLARGLCGQGPAATALSRT